MKATIVGLLSMLCTFSVYSQDWIATLEKYCLDCHDSQSEKGDFNLESIIGFPVEDNLEKWETVIRQLDARQMPPIGKSRPDENIYSDTVNSIVKKLDTYAAAHPRPGKTDTLRRLNRTEYQNAIRDLLALEVDASALLPSDESSHGFDNITVGNLSPALLDRYVLAAQKISRLAVGAPLTGPDSRTVRVPPDLSQKDRVEGLPVGTRGGTRFNHHFPRTGTYEIRVRLSRDRNEMIEGIGGHHQMEILLGDKVVKSIKLEPPRKRNDHTYYDANLIARFEVDAGSYPVGVTFVRKSRSIPETFRQPYEAQFNYHRHPRREPAIYQVSVVGPFGDKGPGDTASRQRIFSGQSAEKDLSRLARIAWRGQLSEADLTRLIEFYQQTKRQTGSADSAIEAAVSAILVSRKFLFRTEIPPKATMQGTVYPISDIDLASRLSFFLWSSLPDTELLDLAEQKPLQAPGQLVKQVDRMLADPKSVSLVSNFANQWLYLRNLDSITPDGRLFPDFDDNLRRAFKRETELLFQSVINDNRSVIDLLTADYTHLNERLAKHYGIPHIYGSHFRKVQLDDQTMRGGLLRQGSILTVTSYANRTSPVIRGNWILENFLGTPVPPAPPNVPTLEENTVSESLPIRERLAAHRADTACASCHNVMDPIGFALENYDAIGRWRTSENGEPIDASGGTPNGNKFESVTGLEASLLERPEIFVRTLTEKLLTFALGRGIEPTDAPAVRQIVNTAKADNYRFASLIKAIVQSVPFTMREA